MAKKAKQKEQGKKQEEQNVKKNIPKKTPEKKTAPLTKEKQSQIVKKALASAKTATPRKEPQKGMQEKKNPSAKRLHIDPWAIGLVLFGLSIIFTLLLSTAFATGIQQAKHVSNIIVTSIQDTFAKDEPVVIDNRIEALDGTLHEEKEMHYPVAIMIDNLLPARPQSHIQHASVVYESLVESGITRFMALFDYGDLDKIGPIRSARPYYVQWADAIDAAYMHAGGSPEALLKIREYSVKDTNGGQYYWRDTSRAAPHNLYTSSDLFMKALRDYEWLDDDQTFTRWTFADAPDKGSLDNGGNLDLYFAGSAESSHVRWEYDPEKLNYKRLQAGVAHNDAATGEQLRAKTIVVQIIPPIVSIGDKGRLSLEIVGSGTAHIVHDGKRTEGTWSKPDITSRTIFFDENGEETVFPRGNIFVEVIPSDREVIFE